MILAAFIGFFLMDVAAHHYVVLAAISLLIMSIEAVNSACELIVDHLSPDYSQFAKHAKDLLSFAVFCILLMFGVYVTYVAGIWFAS